MYGFKHVNLPRKEEEGRGDQRRKGGGSEEKEWDKRCAGAEKEGMEGEMMQGSDGEVTAFLEGSPSSGEQRRRPGTRRGEHAAAKALCVCVCVS